MNNPGFNQNGILSPIHIPQRNGRLNTTSLLSPRRDVSFLSSTRLSPMSTPRYSLSQNNSPKLKNEVHGNGPLLASQRFNVNLRTYTDAKSPGLASRIVQYDEEQRNLRTPTHQAKYDRPGLFPVVHFFKKEIPVIKPKKTRVTIKLAPPEVNLYMPNTSHDDATANSVFQSTTEPDMGTRSVLDALKEISHKRIHSNEDFSRNHNLGKPAKRQNLGNEYTKRMREESPPKSDSSPSKPVSKKMCVIDPVYASNTSSMLYMQKGRAKATKVRGTEDAELSPQKQTKKIKNAETQTVQEIKVLQDIVVKKPQEKEVVVTPPKEVPQQRPLFNEKIYEIRKKNKLSLMLGAITGEKPILLQIPSKDELNTEHDNKKIVSILSPENKEKSKNVKHVSFNMSENKIKEIEENKIKEIEENKTANPDLGKADNKSKSQEDKHSRNTDRPDSAIKDLKPDSEKVISEKPFESNTSSQSPLSRTSSANFGYSTSSTSIYSAPVSSATIFGSDKIEFSFGKSDNTDKTVTNSSNFAMPKCLTFPPSDKEVELIKDAAKTPGFSFGGNNAFSPNKEAKNDVDNLSNTSSGQTATNVATTLPSFGISETLKNSKSEFSFGSKTTNVMKFSSATPTTASSLFSNITNSNITSTTPIGATNGPSGDSVIGESSKTNSIFGKSTDATPLIGSNTVSSSTNSSFGTSAPTFSFGTTTKTSSSPSFGTTTTTLSNNVMAFGNSSPKTSFGNTTTTASIFGNTSTATPTFGNTKITPAFGSTTSSLENTTPSFGNVSKLPIFGSTTSTSSFGNTTITPAFGASSTALSFGATTTTFGTATSTPSFGTATSTPSFGTATSTPSFGIAITTVSFGTGTTTAPFGSANTTASFGTATTALPFGTSTTSTSFGTPTTATPFGTASAPAFGVANTTLSFGTTNTTASFGTPNATPTFGAANTTPAFGTASTTLAFGGTSTSFTPSNPSTFGVSTTTASTPSFGLNTTTTGFGNATTTSTSTFGSSFGTTTTPSSTFPAFGSSTNTSSSFPAFGTSFGTTTTTAPFGNFGATTTTVATPFGTSKPGGFAYPAPPVTQSAFGNNSNTPAFGTTKPFGSISTTNNFPANTTANTFGNSTSTKTFGNAMTGSSTFGNTPASTSTFGSSNTNIFGGGNNNNTFGGSNSGSTFGNTSTPTFGNSTPAFGNNNVTSSVFGATTSAPVFSFGGSNTPSFSTAKTNTTTGGSFSFNATPASSSTFGNPQPFGFNATTTTAPSTFPTFGTPNNSFAAGSNMNNGPSMSFTAQSPPQQQSGVFSFGSNNTTPAKPAVFSFGSTETPKSNFNFPGMQTPNQTNSFASPNFNPGGGTFNPQFNTPTPGVFSMGTGSTTRPRTQLRAKRRT